jgi:hypothetical protein
MNYSNLRTRRGLLVILALISLLAISVMSAQGSPNTSKGPLAVKGAGNVSAANAPRDFGPLLYDQTGSTTGNGIASQIFPDFSNNSLESADDFVVPAEGWSIGGVLAQGVYFNGTGPALIGDILIYADDAGLPADTATCEYNAVPVSDDSTAGNLSFELLTTCDLTAGTYWLSVLPVMSFTEFGQWGWLDNTPSINIDGAWRDPDGLIGSTCVDWTLLSVCPDFLLADTDFSFQLYGPSVGIETETPTDEPTATDEPTNTPGGPTETPTDEPTATPTDEPPGTELIQNGDFENLGSDGKPDVTPWTIKNSSGEKAKCNKDKDGDGIPDKIFANTGNCAFAFKGVTAEAGKLEQVIDLTGVTPGVGDTLNLTFAAQTKGGGEGKAKVVFKYGDDTKTKISVTVGATDDVYAPFAGTADLTSADITKSKINFKMTTEVGKMYVDGVSLRLVAAAGGTPTEEPTVEATPTETETPAARLNSSK